MACDSYGGATATVMGLRQRQGYGHEWNRAMDGGQSWWRTPNLAPVSAGFRLARYAPEWP